MVVLHEHGRAVGRGLGHGVGERVVHRSVGVPRVPPAGVEGRLAGEVPQARGARTRAPRCSPRRRPGGTPPDRGRAAARGTRRPRPRRRWPPRGRRRTCAAAIQVTSPSAASGPIPDTSPPAPRLLVSVPSSARSNDTGPRFDTRTIGRSGRAAAMGGPTVSSGTWATGQRAWRGCAWSLLPTSCRGTASAAAVAKAIGDAAFELGWDCDEVPMADGGEGTLDALGGANRVDHRHRPARRAGRGRLAAGRAHRGDRDGRRLRSGAGRRRRRQRSRGGVDHRHRRADRRGRSTPARAGSSSGSAARPPPTAGWARCGPCTRSAG